MRLVKNNIPQCVHPNEQWFLYRLHLRKLSAILQLLFLDFGTSLTTFIQQIFYSVPGALLDVE